MRTPLRGAAIAKAVCLTQLGILAVAAVLIGGLWGRPQALAAVYGGLAALIPTAYFGLRVFARGAEQTPQEMMGAIYRGEIGKFGLTVLFFGLGAVLFARQFLPLIATYAACLLAYWLVMARMGFD